MHNYFRSTLHQLHLSLCFNLRITTLQVLTVTFRLHNCGQGMNYLGLLNSYGRLVVSSSGCYKNRWL
jgi:hypothetical protein